MINVKSTNNYISRTETLTKYYQEVRNFDVLTAEQEKNLFDELAYAKKMAKDAKKQGNKEMSKKYDREIEKIREFIINSNLRFVISIARVYATSNNILDLIDEGNLGLIEAVDTFDASLGNRFQTHAIYLIRRRINMYRQGPELMVVKNNESKTYHIISNMTSKFIQEFQREPSSDELKDYINKHYPQANIKDSADCLTLRMMSIDETAEDSDGDTIASSVAQFNNVSSSHNDYERTETDDQYKAIVESLLKDFSERDKKIIKMHFGIGEAHGIQVSADEIAFQVNLTPERVRQIIADSIKKIQKEYKKRIRF